MTATSVLNVEQFFVGPRSCPKCGATVVWARTRTGKSILMDFRPVPLGDFCIVGLDPPERIVAKLHPVPEGASRFMCHFDTCAKKRPYRRPYRYRPSNLDYSDELFKQRWDARAKRAS